MRFTKKRKYEIMISGEETLKLNLVFSPSEVASYDFFLPIAINKLHSLADFHKSESKLDNRERQSTTPKSVRNYANYFPKKRVLATGLRPALKLSTTQLHFEIPLVYLEKLQHGGFFEAKVFLNL